MGDSAIDAFVAAAKAGAKPMLGAQRSRPVSTGRLIFALDATASRQPTWDLAASVTFEMFREVGGLDVQLCFYRGLEFRAFDWVSNPARLTAFMGQIRCLTGYTQISKVLDHARAEDAKRKVGALAFIGDAVETIADRPQALIDAAGSLGLPAFMFQEADDPEVEAVFKGVASASGGAWARFQPGAGKDLAAMLKAAAVYAAGGAKALEGRTDPASRLMLAQMRK
jgi:hypothetical protein